MPLYEYACPRCSHQFEMLVRAGDVPACPVCATTDLRKLMSVAAVGRADGGEPATAPGAGPCGSCGDPRGPGACAMR